MLSPSQTKVIIGIVTNNAHLPMLLRSRHILLVKDDHEIISEGYLAIICFDETIANKMNVDNVYCLSEDMTHLEDGDVLRLNPITGGARVMHRKAAHHNSFLVTERCNSFCLMCSQPPRDIDDSYLVDELEMVIPLVDKDAIEICLSGGEPTLLGEGFYRLVKKIKLYLPRTSLHVLSNGRNFSDPEYAQELREIGHPDIMVGVPLYSDVQDIHDFIVQSRGAYNEAIRGILNLKANGIKVELRVVIHNQNYQRLPELAEFICRNLTFVDHVALMGLEMTGFTKVNLEALWIDPVDYQAELSEAVRVLDKFRIRTSVYNHQLCLLDTSLYPYNVKSISDWKNEYMPECDGCVKKNECGGFFSSAVLKHSENIKPFRE